MFVTGTFILDLWAYCALTEALLTAEGSMALLERADMPVRLEPGEGEAIIMVEGEGDPPPLEKE